MPKILLYGFLFVTIFSGFKNLEADYSAALITSTEADPDSFIDNCVNILTGDYCESNTDLSIVGPDPLVLQRYYNSTNYITGQHVGGWRIFPQCFLVAGKEFNENLQSDNAEELERTYAFTGERSGGILTYSGWRTAKGTTIDPLRIDLLKDGKGIVNTYAIEIKGQVNHKNNLINCLGKSCELHLGDGTVRIFKKVKSLPSELFGEELNPFLAAQVSSPEYFHLTQETLPSGNLLFYSYNAAGHISKIEMTNAKQEKTISWLKFTYELQEQGYLIRISASDNKKIEYQFKLFTFLNGDTAYALTEVRNSQHRTCSYDYLIKDNLLLLERKKIDLEYLEVQYNSQNRVKSIKKPNAFSGNSEATNTFVYFKNYTDVMDSSGLKIRYHFDDRLQLTGIDKFDAKGSLYRSDKKIWGNGENVGCLQSKYGSDGNGLIHYYNSYKYDVKGNVVEKTIYGNLTGKDEVVLQISKDNSLIDSDKIECSNSTFAYSKDRFNLLMRVGDVQGTHTDYYYKPGTNLCVKELIWESNSLRKRFIRDYNDDAICVQIAEDDSISQDEKEIIAISERHIKKIYPKLNCPYIGLPEIIEDKVCNPITNQEILVKKIINTFDLEGKLLRCDTYDGTNQLLFSEEKAYNEFGLVISETDIQGNQNYYTYDNRGNLTSKISSRDNKITSHTYDFRNYPIKTVEVVGDHTFVTENTYDHKGRKISENDQFGNTTKYIYDEFGRLIKVIFPMVQDVDGRVIEPTFSYAYDIFGNVICETDACNHIITKTYNLKGKITKINYPDGSRESFVYFLNGELHKTLSRDNITTIYNYDYQNRILSQKSMAWENDGAEKITSSKKFKYTCFRCIESKDMDLVTKYKFDIYGRPIMINKYSETGSSNDNNSQKSEITYDNLNRIRNKKVWFDAGVDDYSVENYEYDLAGNMLVKYVEDASGKILLKREYVYDLNGRCLEEYGTVNGERQLTVKTVYNQFGEPIVYDDALGNKTFVHIDYKHLNSLGQNVVKKTIVNSLGTQTLIEFDALSRVINILKKNVMDQILSNQRIFYDACGNKSCEIHDQIFEGRVIGSSTSRWVYGPMGRLDEEIEAYDSEKEKRTKYKYNLLGQLISKEIPGCNNSLNYEYHGTGQLRSVKCTDVSKPQHQQVANLYDYNDRGIICKATSELNPTSVLRYFNSFSQMTSETVGIGQSKYIVNYKYDRKGRIKTILLPDQSSIFYTYDGLYCRSVQRLSSEGEILFSHLYNDYDQNGKLLCETLIRNVGERKLEYDLNGKITKIDIPNLYTQENQYDALGRLVGMQCTGVDTSAQFFSYNDLTQLVSEKNQEINVYSYDSLDNRMKVNDEQLIYGALNQLKVHGNSEYSYDEQGNLSNRKINRFNLRIYNNALSETNVFLKADQKKLYCTYDSFGRRLLKTYREPINHKLISCERFLYIGDEEVGTIDVEGKITELRIPGISGNTLSSKSVGIEINNKTYAPIHSIEGNIVALVDPISKTVQESYSYSAFGKENIFDSNGIKINESLLGNPWRYAEKRVDKETGMVFFGRRYYDPKEGRWLNPDPLGILDGPNSYAYVHNNPLNCHDCFGLITEDNSKSQDDLFLSKKRMTDGLPEGFRFGSIIYTYEQLHPEEAHNLRNTLSASNGLPTITYNDFFEKDHSPYNSPEDFYVKVDLLDRFWPYTEPSKIYDLNLPEKKNFRIGFINGICNNYDESMESVAHISKLANGYNVHAVYNASHGCKMDITECVMGLSYKATEPVRQLHKMWGDFFSESSNDATFLMICHSQGAIHVRNALLDYPEDLRNRIAVVAIAPGGYIYQQTCASVTHYRVSFWRDIVPRFDFFGSQRSKNTITKLDSHSKAPLHDHSFVSPTYSTKLNEHIEKYLGY